MQIAHCGDTDDLDYIERLIDSGVYVGLDRYGLEMYLPIEKRNATAAELLRRGHAERVMISQDYCATIDWFPPEAAEVFESSGAIRNWSMTLVFDEVVPALREQGVLDDDTFATIFTENPQALADRLSRSAGPVRAVSQGRSAAPGPRRRPTLLTAGLAGCAERRPAGSAPHSSSASSAPSAGSSHARWASASARITGIRSWIAAAMRLGAESQVSSATLSIQRPSIFAGVHTAANANGTPSSTWKKNGWRGWLRFSGFSHSK